MGDLGANEGGNVDDNRYVREKCEIEYQRGEDPDGFIESEFQIFEHAGQLQFVKYRKGYINDKQGYDNCRTYAVNII